MAIFPATTDQAISRSNMIAYMNVGTSTSVVWAPIGWHNSDSAITVDIDTDTQKDILGNVFTNASTPELSQEFDPLPLHTGTSSAQNVLQNKIHEMWMSQNFAALSNTIDALIVYKYSGPEANKFDAHRFPASTLEFGDFGGAADEPLSMPFTLHYGGAVQIGTVTYDGTTPTFAATNMAILANKKKNEEIGA
jgi:hypothetical protein